MKYMSMLRGINVGGKNRIKMDDLKRLYSSMGLEDPQTYVQSGNVAFGSSISDQSKLETAIHGKIMWELSLNVPVLVRSRSELAKLIKKTPFSDKDPSKLHVTFLSKSPSRVDLNEISTAKAKNEDFHLAEREIYLFCPNGYGVTKLSNSFFEKKFGVTATTRNWNTVNALFSMVS